ncbi:DsbA family protein [Peribacillus loiseleuriae]|uniref:DsbA family protein n=1 Tax=Peribacillus loiseleuriae TaxID=1679170 RepID=UPI00069DC35B|nr:hypothetical protein [Peribacillus loiseleuriae]
MTISFINVLFQGDESKLSSLAAEAVYKQSPESYWAFHKELFKAHPSENHDVLWITNERILEIANTIPDIDVQQLQGETNGAGRSRERLKFSKRV